MSIGQRVKVIPVLDLMAGQVVRARRGERSTYLPIISGLADGSDPQVIAKALLAAADALTPSDAAQVLYLADIDALTGRGVQLDAIATLLAAVPSLTLWLDAGFTDVAAARTVQAALGAAGTRVRAVYGSESLASAAALEALRADASAILSLDSRHARPLDPAGCWQRPELWPRSVIVMTLDQVGAASGPALDVFTRLRAAAPDRVWIGAGGVRDAADLDAAAAAGASAWLIASALHDGSLRTAALHH